MTRVICPGKRRALGSIERFPRCAMVQLPDRNCSKTAFLLLIAAIALAETCASQAPPPVTSGEQIPVPGHAVLADYGQLSEHNREWVMTQPPQGQAEFLLGAAINHDH